MDNPFIPIYKACYTGTGKEKLANPLPFPRMVDVELTNLCNFQCRICPTGMRTVKRNQGFMTGNIYQKILNELRIYGTPIRFVRWGEPTLHPQLTYFIEQAKKGGLLCHINTNGFFMDSEFISRILHIPLDVIKFSMQGINRRDYKKMRAIDFFDELLANIKELYLRRNDRRKPFIEIGTTIMNDSTEDVVEFKRQLSQVCDRVTIGETRNLNKPAKRYIECPEVFDKLSVNWDGLVTACCGDYDNEMIVGDIKETTLKEIWGNSKMKYYRQMLADMRHAELPLCRNCAR